MKQKILGSYFGKLALSIREKYNILHAAYFSPERVGTIANDQLATKLVTTLCQPGKTFIDVGAHIGSIIAEVIYNDSSIKIVAIEAIPEKVVNLKRKFPSIEIHGCAVGESAGEISFFVNLNRSGFSSLIKPHNLGTDQISEITVPIKKLDEIVLSDNVDVMKIDVEGAELGVLRGSTRLLKENRPTIMFESAPQQSDQFGYTKENLYDFFASNNYVLVIPSRVAHDDPELSKTGFIESHQYPRRTTNYFAIPKERRTEIN